jgi:hypothetical protein
MFQAMKWAYMPFFPKEKEGEVSGYNIGGELKWPDQASSLITKTHYLLSISQYCEHSVICSIILTFIFHKTHAKASFRKSSRFLH